MKFRTILFLLILISLMTACGQAEEQSLEFIQTSVAATSFAAETATAQLLQAVAQTLTALAPTATNTFTPTLTPTDTPLPTDTPIPSSTATSTLTDTPVPSGGGGGTASCAQQCSGGGCHNIKINNKTGENVYLTLNGPGYYCFTVPPGVGQRYWILPGYYSITIEKCGGEVIQFNHQLNSGWYFDIKCD